MQKTLPCRPIGGSERRPRRPQLRRSQVFVAVNVPTYRGSGTDLDTRTAVLLAGGALTASARALPRVAYNTPKTSSSSRNKQRTKRHVLPLVQHCSHGTNNSCFYPPFACFLWRPRVRTLTACGTPAVAFSTPRVLPTRKELPVYRSNALCHSSSTDSFGFFVPQQRGQTKNKDGLQLPRYMPHHNPQARKNTPHYHSSSSERACVRKPCYVSLCHVCSSRSFRYTFVSPVLSAASWYAVSAMTRLYPLSAPTANSLSGLVMDFEYILSTQHKDTRTH